MVDDKGITSLTRHVQKIMSVIKSKTIILVLHTLYNCHLQS